MEKGSIKALARVPARQAQQKKQDDSLWSFPAPLFYHIGRG